MGVAHSSPRSPECGHGVPLPPVNGALPRSLGRGGSARTTRPAEEPNVKRPNATCAVVFACCALFPETSSAQEARRNEGKGLIRPTLEGLAAGLGLAFAYINHSGEGWPIADGAALPLALAAGVGTAFAVRGASSGLEPTEGRRPRLRVAAGVGSGMNWDYSLGYRTPVRERGELEAMVLVFGDSWERIETQTRCDPLIGCFTGEFLTDYRYRQSFAVLGRGAFALHASPTSRSALAIGAGPTLANVELQGRPPSRRTALLVDGALAVEFGGKSRWTAEAGLRVVAPSPDAETGHYRGGWSVRVGRALGY